MSAFEVLISGWQWQPNSAVPSTKKRGGGEGVDIHIYLLCPIIFTSIVLTVCEAKYMNVHPLIDASYVSGLKRHRQNWNVYNS